MVRFATTMLGVLLSVVQLLGNGVLARPLASDGCEQPRVDSRQLVPNIQSDGVHLMIMGGGGAKGVVSLRLESFGWATPQPIGAGVVVSADGVEIRRSGITEWYRDTVHGFQQGFTIHSAEDGSCRAHANSSLLRLRLQLDGGCRVQVLPSARDARLVPTSGMAALSYTGLRAWDSTGQELDAWLEDGRDALEIVVDDRSAVYPVTVDPWIGVEEAKLFRHPGPPYFPDFAHVVSLSGNVAVAGAVYDQDGQGVATGAAFVYERQGTRWAQVARLIGSDSGGADGVGYGVAVDGTTMVVAALGHDHFVPGQQTGAAYVFERDAMGWHETTELIPSDFGSVRAFGASVAISGDTIAVADPLLGLFGAIYIFVRSGQGWVEQAKLVPTSSFPNNVALHQDTLIVGAPFYSGSVFAGGEAFLFERVGTTWLPPVVLRPNDPVMNGEYGHSVAVHGNLAAVGSWNWGPFNDQTGAVYVYERGSSGWSLLGQLIAFDSQHFDQFGSSVALFGEQLLVGAQGRTDLRGAVYAFEWSGNAWVQFGLMRASDASFGDNLGCSTSFDGNVVLSGAEGAQGLGGAAYAFRVGWPSFCFGDGSLPTACPCAAPDLVPSPSGAPRSGCANSFDFGGARLQARGVVEPDLLSFQANIGPAYGGFALLVKGDGHNAAGIASGDGVRCVDGALIRFGGHNAGANGERPGTWVYPNGIQTTSVSVASAQTVGQTAYYQLVYRNAAAGFCSPATTNWTNAVQVDW